MLSRHSYISQTSVHLGRIMRLDSSHWDTSRREYVLNNIKQSFNTKAQMIEKYNNFVNDSGLELNYDNFFNYYNVSPIKLYKAGISFTGLKNDLILVRAL